MKTTFLCLFICALVFSAEAQTSSYTYKRIGNPQDVTTKPTAGYALMGGGSDLDEAFRWLCDKGAGGDFLILRAAGGDDYNPYVNGLCKANSVATLIIPSREAAADPKVRDIIEHAETVFIAGGDQARYINWWMGTPVQDALNKDIAAGKPIGGTSAGLAVLGQYIYSAQGDAPDDEDLTSAQALANPYMPRVTVRRNFLNIDLLRNTLTDTHFAKRNRMGRSLAFLARIVQDGWSPDPREIAVDEKNAVLVEKDGHGRVVGGGKGAYFISFPRKTDSKGSEKSVSPASEMICRENAPLTLKNIAVYHGPANTDFSLNDWRGTGGTSYVLSVSNGKVESTQPGGGLY